MSYSLVSHDGAIGQVASAQGMNDLLEFVQRVGMRGTLMAFVSTGETQDIPDVIKEIVTVYIPRCSSPQVRETLVELARELEQAQDWAVISD